MDPVLTSDGRPYGPIRFKEIVKERYLISKTINTSYNEIGEITPLERKYIAEFIIEEIKAQEKANEEFKQKFKK